MSSDLEILSLSLKNAKNHSKVASSSSKPSRKRKSDADPFDSSEAENDPAPKAKKAKKDKDTAASDETDLFSISLPGDSEGTVEIYDSCDEIRRKINAHLKSSITKTQFLRDIVRAAYPDSHTSTNIQSKQLSDFLTKKGATAGSTSKVFYAGYVYFEKKRLSEGKAKSKHRTQMEAEWGRRGGLPRERERGYWCAPGMVPVQDKFGKINVVNNGRAARR
ncbi:hypothetical protein AAF712_000045 [Marasmius tenuissimus]|uniref:DUF7726 domain-containing protein n=1 Tax=Marasmius tenuissimus TaxID=585030 RepID=A0ABR3AEZ6_9AGAR|nr:hypothetical protein PM082_000759 [Marasmius tenuissimus]